jgi:hypothetical protein
MNEFLIWKEKDRHQLAYESMANERGKKMAEQLKIDLSARDNACVRCHGGVVPAGVEPFQLVPKEDGVTCLVCHGAFAEWVKEHQPPANRAWLNLNGNRLEKEKRYGMRDLWDPKKRVDTCLACHVGDVKEGKILTHDMYAAGHPPLPSIEVATFSAQEPRHWQYLREKDPVIQQRLAFHKDRLEQTEVVAVSGIETLKNQLTLLSTSPSGDMTAGFPDFARYDCAACHHELVRSDISWRKPRGLPRACPPTPTWPLALLRVGLEAADSQKADAWYSELRSKLLEFDVAMTERPFGNLEKAKPIAEAIISWLNGPLGALDAKAKAKPGTNEPVVDRTTAISMLRRLGDLAATTSPDHESARQMVWAYRTIYQELMPEEKDRDKEVMSVLDRLDQRLGADLRAPGASGRKPITDSLAERLEAASKYKPADFRQDFAQLLDHLPK